MAEGDTVHSFWKGLEIIYYTEFEDTLKNQMFRQLILERMRYLDKP